MSNKNNKTIPVWKVFYNDFNGKSIEEKNVFEFSQMVEICKTLKDIIKKYVPKHVSEDSIHNEDVYARARSGLGKTLDETLKNELRYYFWAKCEYEVIVSEWPPHRDTKIVIESMDKQYKEHGAEWHHSDDVVDSVITQAYLKVVDKKVDIYSQLMMNFDCFKEVVYKYIGYNA